MPGIAIVSCGLPKKTRAAVSMRGAAVGDVVQVTRTDGVVAVFEVTRVARYPKTAFPTDVVFGAIDHAGLRLITCGGDYEQAVHRYSDNVVAFARLTGWHPSQQQ